MLTPNGDNVIIGSGDLYFNRKEVDGTYKGFRYAGNASKLEGNPQPTTIEKKGSNNAARAIIARAITETKMELAITLDEFTPDNLALAFLGEVGSVSQSSATKTAATLGNAVVGYALDTGFKNITLTDVKHSATVFVLGTDYDYDPVSGMVFILPGGSITDAMPLTWDGSVPAFTAATVEGMANGNIEGKLRYVSSVDQVGPRVQVDVHRIAIAPSGVVALIGDAFAELPLTGEVLADPTQPSGKQFITTTYLPPAP